MPADSGPRSVRIALTTYSSGVIRGSPSAIPRRILRADIRRHGAVTDRGDARHTGRRDVAGPAAGLAGGPPRPRERLERHVVVAAAARRFVRKAHRRAHGGRRAVAALRLHELD